MENVIALDRSARTVDADGRLHIAVSHISKANICPYYGREIPGYQSLGLDPDKVYRLFRDPVELERGAASFARLPILSTHQPVTTDTLNEEQKKLVVGSIGSDVKFVPPYLDADLCFWDKSAIAGIETDSVKELSCGYRYIPVMEPGEYNGEAYDGKMTEIRGNHLALVQAGRAGSDVVVADAKPFFKEEVKMKMSRLGKALFAAIGLASPALAADSALPGLVGNADRKNLSGLKAKLLAMDATLSAEQLDNVIDALLDVEQEPKPVEPVVDPLLSGAGDESPEGKVRSLLEGKVDEAVIAEICGLIAPAAAEDEEPKKEEEGMKKEDVEAAMDSLRKGLREASEAAREVRQTVGDVVGMDSASDVYAFALDHLKIDHAGVEGVPALRALYRTATAVKQPARIAQDSAAVADAAKLFPNLGRFGRA